ncbi:hypothetical protein BJV77DRAFT_1156550 [Russula vinacea]|nr:hypothetical protein BJV77DRAFT_1156550 [Russula vinacea]
MPGRVATYSILEVSLEHCVSTSLQCLKMLTKTWRKGTTQAPRPPSLDTESPSLGESNYDDSSGQFFSIYSKAAEEEDNKMVERWQEDAQGILIFTGLFSAAVAALLSVTVQDLRPNSQDTSAFYLGNIYGVLADPNIFRLGELLWFLSLVMSLSCALWATSLHQWARRYIRLTQPARCSPEKRARMRAFFANGVDKMRIPWAVEGLPTLLHLSLFLFFGGLVIFLFSVDREVFTCVVWWIGLFSIVYGLITLLPLIRQDSPYYTPLSISTWILYAGIQYMTLTILAFISDIRGCNEAAYLWYRLRHRYRDWMLVGVENIVSKTASKPSLEVDVRIFGWTISALGNDNSLEKFFEAIPGLFNSN